MGAETSIEWTDKTWNPVTGCTKVSEGCRNCYADRLHTRFYKGHQKGSPVPPCYQTPFTQVMTWPDKLKLPLRWRKPSRIFVNSMSDLFHKDVPFEFIAAVWGVMAACPQHTFQVLTKRPERAVEFFEWLEDRAVALSKVFPHDGMLWKVHHLMRALAMERGVGFQTNLATTPFPLPNVALLTSVEDHASADERIHHLLGCRHYVTTLGLSMEPLLGPVDLSRWLYTATGKFRTNKATGKREVQFKLRDLLDWIIVGGESGPHARPMHPDWVRRIRDECARAGVPFFFKQWGEWAPCSDDDWHGLGPTGYPPQLCISPCGTQTAGGFFGGLEVQREKEGWRAVQRIGKENAGRLLDGRLHEAYPNIKEHA